jgi:site-specific recombinase XerD
MKSAIVSIQKLIQDFFEEELAVQRNAAHDTVRAYRDALKLFLTHAAEKMGCAVDQLDHAILDVDMVRSFLDWLRDERECGPRTRNHRLAVIKAFARYVASVAPEHLERCRRIRELRPASFECPEVPYLDEDEVVDLFKAIEPEEHRDRALLILMYTTGARVQEIVNLDFGDIHLDTVPRVTIQGKGNKQRTCPLQPRTVKALEGWLAQRGDAQGPLLLNAQSRRLTRSGVAYILRKLVQRAGLKPRHASAVTPHVIRHTTAMHLLRAGVDIVTTAAYLGHSQLATTHGYVEIDLRMKQKAIAATSALPVELSGGKLPEGKLLVWLESLGKSQRYVQSPPPIPPREARRAPPLHIT